MSQVSKNIFDQLGKNRFVVMSGAYNLISGDDYLSFRLPKCKDKINYVKIKLIYDAYDIEFGYIRGLNYKVIHNQCGIYVENLKETIESSTGLYLSL